MPTKNDMMVSLKDQIRMQKITNWLKSNDILGNSFKRLFKEDLIGKTKPESTKLSAKSEPVNNKGLTKMPAGVASLIKANQYSNMKAKSLILQNVANTKETRPVVEVYAKQKERNKTKTHSESFTQTARLKQKVQKKKKLSPETRTQEIQLRQKEQIEKKPPSESCVLGQPKQKKKKLSQESCAGEIQQKHKEQDELKPNSESCAQEVEVKQKEENKTKQNPDSCDQEVRSKPKEEKKTKQNPDSCDQEVRPKPKEEKIYTNKKNKKSSKKLDNSSVVVQNSPLEVQSESCAAVSKNSEQIQKKRSSQTKPELVIKISACTITDKIMKKPKKEPKPCADTALPFEQDMLPSDMVIKLKTLRLDLQTTRIITNKKSKRAKKETKPSADAAQPSDGFTELFKIAGKSKDWQENLEALSEEDLDSNQISQESAVLLTDQTEDRNTILLKSNQKLVNLVQNHSPTDCKNTILLINRVAKQSSVKNLSGGDLCKTGDLRRLVSFTDKDRASTLPPKYDPLRQLKKEVLQAMRERKTFAMLRVYESARKALLDRGWIEKILPSHRDRFDQNVVRFMDYSLEEMMRLMRQEDLTHSCQNLIKSKLLGDYQVDFYWGLNEDAFQQNPEKVKTTLINKLKRDIFSYTNKECLCEANKSSYWFQKSNISKLNHPRTYSLGKNGEVRDFINDFHETAAIGLLKWIVQVHCTMDLFSATGMVPLSAFHFALDECWKLVKKIKHEDIDVPISRASDYEWNKFLNNFYKLVHHNRHFKIEYTETEDTLVRKSSCCLHHLRRLRPFLDMDGMMNIWILKPAGLNQGRGIHICRTLQNVLEVLQKHRATRYIIQKYIERPLLIYNTKFDIRQWFLISNCCPLTVWMYKQCYLRFCSKTYSLRKLHESVHLTNNTIQSKYKRFPSDSTLPNYNMWNLEEFQTYLSDIGRAGVFQNVIYPGMKQSIIACILIHQENMIIRENCFELFGADFMLTEDFQPWLLEVNGNPAMQKTTPVTATLCPQVLDDLVKVVIDYAHDNKAETGSFELIYKQEPTKISSNPSLELKGFPLQESDFSNRFEQEIGDHDKNCKPQTA